MKHATKKIHIYCMDDAARTIWKVDPNAPHVIPYLDPLAPSGGETLQEMGSDCYDPRDFDSVKHHAVEYTKDYIEEAFEYDSPSWPMTEPGRQELIEQLIAELAELKKLTKSRCRTLPLERRVQMFLEAAPIAKIELTAVGLDGNWHLYRPIHDLQGGSKCLCKDESGSDAVISVKSIVEVKIVG